MGLATTPLHRMPPNHQSGQTGKPRCGPTELNTSPPLKHMPDLLSPPLPTAKLERLTFNGMNADNLLHPDKLQVLHSENCNPGKDLVDLQLGHSQPCRKLPAGPNPQHTFGTLNSMDQNTRGTLNSMDQKHEILSCQNAPCVTCTNCQCNDILEKMC